MLLCKSRANTLATSRKLSLLACIAFVFLTCLVYSAQNQIIATLEQPSQLVNKRSYKLVGLELFGDNLIEKRTHNAHALPCRGLGNNNGVDCTAERFTDIDNHVESIRSEDCTWIRLSPSDPTSRFICAPKKRSFASKLSPSLPSPTASLSESEFESELEPELEAARTESSPSRFVSRTNLRQTTISGQPSDQHDDRSNQQSPQYVTRSSDGQSARRRDDLSLLAGTELDDLESSPSSASAKVDVVVLNAAASKARINRALGEGELSTVTDTDIDSSSRQLEPAIESQVSSATNLVSSNPVDSEQYYVGELAINGGQEYLGKNDHDRDRDNREEEIPGLRPLSRRMLSAELADLTNESVDQDGGVADELNDCQLHTSDGQSRRKSDCRRGSSSSSLSLNSKSNSNPDLEVGRKQQRGLNNYQLTSRSGATASDLSNPSSSPGQVSSPEAMQQPRKGRFGQASFRVSADEARRLFGAQPWISALMSQQQHQHHHQNHHQYSRLMGPSAMISRTQPIDSGGSSSGSSRGQRRSGGFLMAASSPVIGMEGRRHTAPRLQRSGQNAAPFSQTTGDANQLLATFYQRPQPRSSSLAAGGLVDQNSNNNEMDEQTNRTSIKDRQNRLDMIDILNRERDRESMEGEKGDNSDNSPFECRKRLFTFKAVKTDSAGNKCSGLVTATICHGGCDTGEITDYVFPYKKSIHTVCTHGARIRRRTLLTECSSEQVSESLREYHWVDAKSCSCQKCTSLDTTCIGSLTPPFWPYI